jgi:NADH-quinone oxidoreductase subunit L
MPVTHLSFLVATLAIAGIWPLAGFFSKDAILAAALHNHHPVIFGTALAVAGLTAFYMFRVYFVTFGGQARTHEAAHGHESPFTMQVPLMLLALSSIAAGMAPIMEFVGAPGEHGIDWAVAGPATAMALLGIGSAWALYGRGQAADPLQAKLGGVYTALKRRLYVDEVYLFLVHKVIFRFVATPVAWFDRHVVDGGVNLTANTTLAGGNLLTRLQSGRVQTYAAWLAGGAIFTAAAIWAALLLR